MFRFIYNYMEKRAINSFKPHDFIQEYGVFIGLVIIVKVATSVFNAYAAYYLFKNYFVSELNSEIAGIIFSIITLILLEFLVNFSLAKFFKTSMRGNMKAAFGMAFLSLVFFGLSFIVSTNGLAQRQSQKADNTNVIIDKFNIQTSELKKQAEQNRNQLLKAIETIKSNPAGWRGGKRDILQPDQLKQITTYYNQIEQINQTLRNDLVEIETQKTNELNINSGNVQIIESKYYKTSAMIMAIQLFVNGLIMFFYSRIYGIKKEDEYQLESVEMLRSNLRNRTVKQAIFDISSIYSNIGQAVAIIQAKGDEVINIPPNKNDKKIGFIPSNEPNSPNDSNNRKTIIVENLNVPNDINPYTRICKNCNNPFTYKHHKKVFCSDKCRMVYWENINHKKLRWNK